MASREIRTISVAVQAESVGGEDEEAKAVIDEVEAEAIVYEEAEESESELVAKSEAETVIVEAEIVVGEADVVVVDAAVVQETVVEVGKSTNEQRGNTQVRLDLKCSYNAKRKSKTTYGIKVKTIYSVLPKTQSAIKGGKE